MTAAILRVTPDHGDFTALVSLLDDEFFSIFGDVYLDYKPHNATDVLTLAAVAYADGVPAACGGIKPLSPDTAELKRMFVKPHFRRLGLAQRIVRELEAAAREQGFSRMALETGADMSAAIALYRSLGYASIENYGPYAGNSACVCMVKELSDEHPADQ